MRRRIERALSAYPGADNVRLGKLDGDWLDRSAAYLAAAGDACGVAAGNPAG